MSTAKQLDQIIIIEDDAETSKNTKFERSNETDLGRNLENVAGQSNAQKSGTINFNSNPNIQKEDLSGLTHKLTLMLGSLHGMSSENVNKMMDSEKGLMTDLHNAIETISKLFRSSSSSKEISQNFQKSKRGFANTSHLEIPPNVSSATNKETPVNNVLIPQKDISVNSQIALINKVMPVNLQRDSNLVGPSINEKEKSTQVLEESRKENLSHGTSSGIKIGDNWELPIIVLDSDDDEENETEVIEIDSDEEEIQELKKIMSLDDNDCIEIGKEEFDKARKGDSEITDDNDTDSEVFIPIVPIDGSISRKRQRAPMVKPINEKFSRRKISDTSDVAIDDDPSKWRKDLLPFPFITNHVLRTWATGFLCYRDQWERLEYLGDKVLMFCVLRFATAKYLRFYPPSDIKVVTTFLVSNKLLAAYSLTLGLDRKNQMPANSITKKVADAFEAYIGAYYLSDGEEATTRYLEQLMSPLFELVLSTIQTGRDPRKVMRVIAVYFHMSFLIKIPKLK